MDILQGYESCDSTEETSGDSYGFSKSNELEEIENTDQKNLESADFFSLSSTQFDREFALENGSSSFISQPYIDASHLGCQQPLMSTLCLENGMHSSMNCSKESSNEYSTIASVPEEFMCTTQDYIVTDRRENLDLKHSRNARRQHQWARSNKKTFQQHTNRHSTFTDDLQAYVSNKTKTTFVSEEKCTDSANKSTESNVFTTPTLIAANLEKTSSQLPRTKYITFNDAHSGAVVRTRWNIPRYSHLFLSASFDKSIKIWDCVDFNTCVASIKSQNGVKDAQWSKCGHQILSGGFDKSVQLHDVETGKCLGCFPTSYTITCLQFHPTEPNLFLAGTYGSAIYCCDTTSGKVVNEYKGKFGEVLDVEFLSNGSEFASASSIVGRDSANRTIMIWDFRTSAVVSNQLYHEKYTCPCLKVHPKENVFLAQSNGNYIAMFSCRRPYKLNKFKRFEGHKIEGYPIGFDFSPDGNIIASGSSDGCVYFYSYKTSKLIKKLTCYGDNICTDVAYHPVLPGVIVTCSWEGSLSVWQ